MNRFGDGPIYRNAADLCELRPMQREKQISTIVTPHGSAKVLANLTDLVASMTKAAHRWHLAIRTKDTP